MDRPPTDYSQARDHMVDGQVRPNKVIDPRIIRAMRSLPRERFVPPHLQHMAYVDEDVALGGGRVLVEPMVIARLVQLARVRDGERVLVVGAGPGYGAALMAACGGTVTALEENEALLGVARGLLPLLAPGVMLMAGPLAARVCWLNRLAAACCVPGLSSTARRHCCALWKPSRFSHSKWARSGQACFKAGPHTFHAAHICVTLG